MKPRWIALEVKIKNIRVAMTDILNTQSQFKQILEKLCSVLHELNKARFSIK